MPIDSPEKFEAASERSEPCSWFDFYFNGLLITQTHHHALFDNGGGNDLERDFSSGWSGFFRFVLSYLLGLSIALLFLWRKLCHAM